LDGQEERANDGCVSGGAAFVAMVKAANFWKGHDLPSVETEYRSRFRRLLA
jgi:hypothetical protein